MLNRWWWLWGLFATVTAVGAERVPSLTDEPLALAWSADEVERAAEGQLTAIVARARTAGQLGCTRECTRLPSIFGRLEPVARAQTARSAVLPWSLTVVRLPDVDALALPGGQVVVSEDFIEQRVPSDEALAFVLAHEMTHSILQHERQVLTYARLLLPRHVTRSVQDMYVEMDFNAGFLRSLEPVLQQGELEADELGLLLASAAGFDPDRQLAFVEAEVARDALRPRSMVLVSTHPSAASRLAQLRERLPLARRLVPARAD